MTINEVISFVINNFRSEAWPITINILIVLSPIFLAIILFVIMWDLWMQYIRAKNYLKTKRVVLELKLPKETFKSPLAMETFLNSLHNTADGSKYAQYWKGESRPWYSLELVSIEGNVKFFIWTEEIRKSNLISALYSQFPEIEVHEAEDYTRSVHFDPKITRIWGGEFKFTMADPYPIKTYIDYGLDKDPKEEYKVDPLTPLIEFLSSVPINQQVWIQIMIRAHKDEQRIPGNFFKTHDAWKEKAIKEVDKLLLRDSKTKVAGTKDEATGFTKLPSISKGEQDIVAALERSITKHPFDVGIRALYIAPKDTFNTPFGIGGIVGSMKHFSSPHLNGLKPNSKLWHMKLDNPWQDFRNYRRNLFSKLALMAYKRRSYFYAPFVSTPLVMNSEELATIYHFPGSVSATPGLERVQSKKAQAPTNLPI
ncbi:MAG: hypothetical protein WCW03_00710 [Candidatus Paceibacterota bacterium]|jgi:hypothetical protein